jgi:DNA-binding NarL/FixJ family response regulator
MIAISSSPESLSFAAAQSPSSGASARKPHQPSAMGLTRSRSSQTIRAWPGLVQPTQAQQVQQLYRRGNTVPQIAYNLNLSSQAVDRYLNISKGN